MVAILSVFLHSVSLSIYDITSSVFIHDVCQRAHSNLALGLETLNWYRIWTHGELLRFSTPGPAGITTWEVRFTPGATPNEVETVSLPNDVYEVLVDQSDSASTEFHPPSSRLAITWVGGPLMVFDVRASRYLLRGDSHYGPMVFSSDGRFFACITNGTEVSLWKESTNGYTIFQKFIPSILSPVPLLSPNGRSFIIFGHPTIQLWHLNSFTTTTSSILPRPLQITDWRFLLEFLPDKPLAVMARLRGKTVTILHLKSSVLQLTIDTPIEVCGLKSIGNFIVVIGDKEAFTWNISGGGFPPDARMNVEDSTQTIHFNTGDDLFAVAGSISLDFQYIALAGLRSPIVYCTSTSTRQVVDDLEGVEGLWFAPGTNDLWCATENDESEVFSITQDTHHHIKTVDRTEYGTWGCPWGSSCGYQVTNEGWVLCQDGKRLLMIPPLWRSWSTEIEQVWKGKFLALLHATLPEPVILELEPWPVIL